jgi:hypothetical protein
MLFEQGMHRGDVRNDTRYDAARARQQDDRYCKRPGHQRRFVSARVMTFCCGAGCVPEAAIGSSRWRVRQRRLERSIVFGEQPFPRVRLHRGLAAASRGSPPMPAAPVHCY